MKEIIIQVHEIKNKTYINYSSVVSLFETKAKIFLGNRKNIQLGKNILAIIFLYTEILQIHKSSALYIIFS